MAFYNSIDNINNFYISFSDHPEEEFYIFAKGYKQAALSLSEQLLDKPHFSVYEAYPVVFLFRHALELYLKDFFFQIAKILAFEDFDGVYHKFRKIHDLKYFADVFYNNCKTHFKDNQELINFAEEVLEFSEEFEQIDKNSQVYRYPNKSSKNTLVNKSQYANLEAIYLSMKELFYKFEQTDFEFDRLESIAQENYELRQDFLSYTGLLDKNESN